MALQNTNYKQDRGNQSYQNDPDFLADFKTDWIKVGINMECIEYTDKFGKALCRELTTSQIRNVFGELKRIQMKTFDLAKTSFLLLKPKMAYAAARDNKRGLQQLVKVFNKAHETVDVSGVNGPKHFQNLMDFMESILAYHKAYGGK
jgi:CRISPR-associated protein Csm2